MLFNTLTISTLIFFFCIPLNGYKLFEHGVFENSKELGRIFMADLKLRDRLRDLRKSLVLSSNNLESFNESDIPFDTKDFEGASKGLIVLLDTYKFNLGNLLQGVVRLYKGETFSGREKLRKDDLLLLSHKAFEIRWFDTSISLLKEYINNEVTLKETDSFRQSLVRTHNEYVIHRRKRVGPGFKVFPFIVDPSTLEKKKKQPKLIGRTNFYNRDLDNLPPIGKRKNIKDKVYDIIKHGEYKEEEFRRVCRGELVSSTISKKPGRCVFLHQNDPFLKLGPFPLEIVSYKPVRLILVDFFTETEMDWLKNVSYPFLSAARDYRNHKQSFSYKDKYEKSARIIHKSVQHWISEIKFKDNSPIQVIRGAQNEYDSELRDWYYMDELSDPYSYDIVHPILSRLSHKIEIATGLNVTSRWASSKYQTTNYGLGGLCENHMDPHGLFDGISIPDDRGYIFKTGDILVTLMGWLNDVELGGATGFDWPGKEGTFLPQKGSAALWFNLIKNGKKNPESTHGGCPIVKGNKWILNKWINYFDQWEKFPCGLDEFEDFSIFKGHY